MKFLIVSEAVSLAHVVRPYRLALALHELGHEVSFASDLREFTLLLPEKVKLFDLPCIGSKTFLNRIRSSQIPYKRNELEEYCRTDQLLLGCIKPDYIVNDFRVSLALSPELTKGHLINIANAYWSEVPNRLWSMPGPQCGIVGKLASFLPPYIRGSLGYLADKMAAAPFDQISVARSLKPKGRFSSYYGASDFTLFADPPNLLPSKTRTSNQIYVGHLGWEPSSEQVEPLPGFSFDIYLALGSSGPTWMTSHFVRWLRDLNLTVLVCAGSVSGAHALKEQFRADSKVWVRSFVAGSDAARRSKITVCNGGSPTTYQALFGGSSVFAVTSNFDQALCMQSLSQRSDVGFVEIANCTERAFKRGIVRILKSRQRLNPEFLSNDKRLHRLNEVDLHTTLHRLTSALARRDISKPQEIKHAANF